MGSTKISCFNCNTDLTRESHRITEFTSLNPSVNINKAIKVIFGVQIPEDNRIFICQTCASILSQLYNSKLHLIRRGKKESKIQRIADVPEVNDENIRDYNFSESTEQILPDDYMNNGNVENENQSVSKLKTFSTQSAKSFNKIDFQELHLLVKIQKLPDTSISSSEKDVRSSMLGKSAHCQDCFRKFPSQKLMNNHHTLVHMPPKILSCPLCPKKFMSEWFLNHHKNICKNKINILHVCHICKEKFTQKKSLEQHELKYHDIRKYPFICNICPESYNEISKLRNHLLENHKESVEANAAALNIKSIKKEEDKNKRCNVCQERFKEVPLLKRHMKIKHGLSGVACSICRLMLANSLKLSVHYRSAHKKCNDCEERFEEIDKLKRHIRIVHEKKGSSFQCEICGITTAVKENLLKHYGYHIEIAGPPKHCIICNKQYKLKNSLKLHLRTHSAKGRELNFKCDRKDCNSKFKYKHQLDYHLKTFHKMKFKFPCKICNQKFICKKTVNAHIRRVHKAEEKFSSFKKSKIVEGITGKVETTSCFSSESLQFRCPVCRKTSEYKTHFQRHLQSHQLSYHTDLYKEQQLPLVLKCKDSQCQNRYSRVDNMLKHFKKYHDTNSKQFSPFYQTCTVCKAKINNMFWDQHKQRHLTNILQKKSRKDLNKFYNEKSNLFKCSVCKTELQDQQDFIYHVISIHKMKVVTNKDYVNDSKNIECPQCHKKFKNDNVLRYHKQRVHVSFDQMIKCHLCERRIKDKADIRRHMKLVHKSRQPVKSKNQRANAL